MVATLRDALGDGPRLRLDVNSSWSVPQALRMLERLAEYDIDFVEQPVRETPLGQLGEVRARSPIAVCSNEGLWSEADAYARIRAREADVYCLSPSWVGSLARVLAARARRRAARACRICKHTHGELGIAAAAGQHVAADAAERRRRAPADGADDGARRAHARSCRSRTAPHWGRDRRARARRRGRRRRGRRGGRALPQRGPVPARGRPYLLGREDRP